MHYAYIYIPYGRYSPLGIMLKKLRSSLQMTYFELTYMHSSMQAVRMFGASQKESAGREFYLQWSHYALCLYIYHMEYTVHQALCFSAAFSIAPAYHIQTLI